MLNRGGYWPEGARNLLEATVKTNTALSNRQAALADFDVTGHSLDVGEYLAGNPCCWEAAGDEEAETKPVVSIGVNCCTSANVPASTIMNRGAAVLSYVDALEAAGFRVELWSCFAATGGGVEADIRTLVKAAGETWSPAAVAFSICHPAWLRRVMFRHYETDPEHMPMINGGSYGRVTESHLYDSDGKVDGIDVYLPGMMGGGDASRYSTPEKAIDTVGAAVDTFMAGRAAQWRDGA